MAYFGVPGDSEETRQRCMEPFFTTKGDRGTGLGLSMVYGIVQRHEGAVTVDSQPGHGTTFAIRLPMLDLPPVPAALAVAPPPNGPLRLLLVDDEPLVRELLQALLQEVGHQVETAENGILGLDKFQAQPFDIVLTDVAMPHMGGLELAREIHLLKPGQPVIMLTGFGDLMNAAGECPPGVTVVLSKPVTIQALMAALAKALAKVALPIGA